MRLSNSKKGISGAISAMFLIAIFFIALLTVFTVTSAYNNYVQTVNQRNQMDWERTSEHITFIAAKIGGNGKLNVTFFNDGGVTLHIVQVWLAEFQYSNYSDSTWQKQYWISRYVSSGETVNNLGFYSEFRRIGISSMGELTSLSGLSDSKFYKVKLVTERGNTFECQVPYPPPSEGSGGGGWAKGGYVLEIDNNYANFQYTISATYLPAFVKPKTSGVNTMYRILLRNTSIYDLVMLSNTTMLTLTPGQTGLPIIWYIISPRNDVAVSGSVATRSPIAFVPEHPENRIRAGESAYIYFGAIVECGNQWQQDYSTSKTTPLMFACLLAFHYDGQFEARSVPTPVIIQMVNV